MTTEPEHRCEPRLVRPGRRWFRVILHTALLSLTVLVNGCGGASGLTPDPDTHAPRVPVVAGALPRPAHVVVVVFENKGNAQVVGAPDAPYLTSLAKIGAVFSNAHGIAHPSQPNYLALLSGATQSVTDDSCPQDLGDAPNLARQLLDAGDSFTGYAEALPTPGSPAARPPAAATPASTPRGSTSATSPPAATCPTPSSHGTLRTCPRCRL